MVLIRVLDQPTDRTNRHFVGRISAINILLTEFTNFSKHHTQYLNIAIYLMVDMGEGASELLNKLYSFGRKKENKINVNTMYDIITP